MTLRLLAIFSVLSLAVAACSEDPIYVPEPDTTEDTAGDGSDTTGGDTGDDTTQDDAEDDTGQGDDTGDDTGGDTEDGSGDGDTEPPCPDEDDDGVCDEDDICPGFDDAICRAACADTEHVKDIQVFGEGYLFGCAGSVSFQDRDWLCGEGYEPASAIDWFEWRGDEDAPAYSYWTDENLGIHQDSTESGCGAVYQNSEFYEDCPTGPMRLCVSGTGADGTGRDQMDPLGNSCTLNSCSLEGVESNMDHFGGCQNNFQPGMPVTAGARAGTLCIAREYSVTQNLVPVLADMEPDMQFALRGSLIEVPTVDYAITGFQQYIHTSGNCNVTAYLWLRWWNRRQNDWSSWVLMSWKKHGHVAPGEHWLGIDNAHVRAPFANTQMIMALGWTGACGVVSTQAAASVNSPAFGTVTNSLVVDNEYDGNISGYVPGTIDHEQDLYVPQRYTWYSLVE